MGPLAHEARTARTNPTAKLEMQREIIPNTPINEVCRLICLEEV